MTTEYPARHCAIVWSPKEEAVKLSTVSGDGYAEFSETDSAELAMDIVKAKKPVSQWAVWDNRTNAPDKRRDKPYSAAEFATLVKDQPLALIWVKRGTSNAFRAPILKVGVLDSKANNTGKRAKAQRFGRGA